MPPEITQYHLPPTSRIPNSPFPLLRYRSLTLDESNPNPDPNTRLTQFYDTLQHNNWQAQWIVRYGPTQASHYHSRTHESMVVLTGTATIRFGVSDHDDDEENENQQAKGLELDARAGDIFVIPAGVAHKTFDTSPQASFELLTKGHNNKRELPRPDREGLGYEVELSGFTMMGAYPKYDHVDGSAASTALDVPTAGEWDFCEGEEPVSAEEIGRIWSIPPPRLDPVFGGDEGRGVCKVWRRDNNEERRRATTGAKL